MSKLEELIQKLCPNGVEYKTMDELGYFYGGLSGKSRDDFVDGNAKFITYKNIYSNLALNLAVDDKVKIEEDENQNTIQYGDVLFTGSSETPDECGFSSVLTTQTEEKLYFQVTYLLENDKVKDREFGAYKEIEDNYPKYVLSLDKADFSRDGIIHKNIIDWLLE